MDDFKARFQQDFEKANGVDLSFDLDQLPQNGRGDRHRMHPAAKGAIIAASIVAGVVVTLPAGFIAATMFRVNESVKTSRKAYSLKEIQIAESNSFRKLNEVSYPDGDSPLRSALSEEQSASYSQFADKTYRALLQSGKKENLSYSVAGLYAVCNEMAGAASRSDLQADFDALLGMDAGQRIYLYDKIMGANSFARENSSIQLKNAAFFTNRFAYAPEYVEFLTRRYCEAYQIDFASEAGKMADWVNQAVYTKGFVGPSFLEMDEETALYLFSTLYFKNAWSHKFLKESNVKDPFYLADGTVIDATFMQHSYMADHYYDYGSYISVKDYYYNGNASVTYLVPKKTEDDIFALTSAANIFQEDEDKKVTPEGYGRITVNLKAPKFETEMEMDFSSCFESLGFGDIFDRNIDSFHGAFTGEEAEGYNFYLQKIKQKNSVGWNEDGTIVKSVSMATFGAGAAAPHTAMDTLDVELNQPFIYIIKDVNGVPIFVGHMDNPTK